MPVSLIVLRENLAVLKNLFGAHVSVRLLEGSMEEVSASHPKPAMTRQQAALSDESKSGIALYRDFAVGEISLAAWLYYEILTVLFSNICGIAGLGLRTLLFPAMFKSCGARPAFGRGMIIRRPSQIALGKKVLLDDYSVLDVRGRDASIEIGDHASIGRFTTVAAKEGHIVFGNGVNIGSYCRVATQTRVEIGESVLVGAYTYIGPGNHQSGRDDEPLISRDMEKKGGVFIGPHVWLGSHVTVLDGVKIGARAVVGAHSLVREDVPEGVVVAGTPARIIKNAF